jgi:DNA polymerase-4/DNA polymerase V
MARTASLGEWTKDVRLVHAHLSRHAFRLGMDMVVRGLAARRLTVFLRLASFDTIAHEVRLPRHTSNLLAINRVVSEALARLFRQGTVASGCGIVAGDLVRWQSRQPDLFGGMDADERALPLWRAVASIRARHGMKSIIPARVRHIDTSYGASHGAPRFRYPLLTANEC